MFGNLKYDEGKKCATGLKSSKQDLHTTCKFTVYMFDRFSGKILSQREIRGICWSKALASLIERRNSRPQGSVDHDIFSVRLNISVVDQTRDRRESE